MQTYQFFWFVTVGSAVFGLLIFIAGKVKDIAKTLDERRAEVSSTRPGEVRREE